MVTNCNTYLLLCVGIRNEKYSTSLQVAGHPVLYVTIITDGRQVETPLVATVTWFTHVYLPEETGRNQHHDCSSGELQTNPFLLHRLRTTIPCPSRVRHWDATISL